MEKKYDWQEIKKFYDEGHTWKDIMKTFGCSNSSISDAVKRGDLRTRSKSEASKQAHKRNPEAFKHSEATKKKISEHRKQYLKDNPDKVPYLLNHHRKGDSYPEKYFKEVFENEGIPLQHHKQVSIYQLDFYNEEKMLALEVDGNQHYDDKNIVESDKRKNQCLNDLGWTVLRIRWSYYQKLPRKERERVVREIREILDGERKVDDISCMVLIDKEPVVERRPKNMKTDACPICGDQKSIKLQYCSQTCFKFASRKVDRPSFDKLKLSVAAIGYEATGRKFGVSGTTIKKWLKQGVVSQEEAEPVS